MVAFAEEPEPDPQPIPSIKTANNHEEIINTLNDTMRCYLANPDLSPHDACIVCALSLVTLILATKSKGDFAVSDQFIDKVILTVNDLIDQNTKEFKDV